MNLSQVAIATVTWARSPDEEALLRASLRHLAHIGLPTAVADTGTSVTFAEFLQGFANVSVTSAGAGLVNQIRASVAVAATFGRRYILYTEPDKENFFREGIRDFLGAAPDEPDVAVVLASRSTGSMGTFPPMQRYTEGVINELCGRTVGVYGDYSYGPFLMHSALAPQVAELDVALGWGWRHRMFLHAHRKGHRVVHVTADHPCPPDQRGEDSAERAHRLRQLSQNILGLLA
jgi:hypothetical protein